MSVGHDAVDLEVRNGKSGIPVQEIPVQGQTVVGEKADIQVKSDGGQLIMLERGANLAEVVKALNVLGATPQDLLAILQAMKASGALRAELEII